VVEKVLTRALAGLEYAPSEVAKKTGAIRRQLLARSSHVKAGNFTSIATQDLETLYRYYDQAFFAGQLGRTLRGRGARISFRLSRRMTRVGGQTSWTRPRATQAARPQRDTFEIAISTTLLYQSFRDVRRSVVINGLPCRDRLDALQRVFEHELIHLAEMLAWGRSSCSQSRFRSLAAHIFQHSGVTHALVSQRERAAARFQVAVGSRVRFEHQGRRLEGFVNRITRRATVLVEHADGERYRDGKRYRKFYVPLKELEPMDAR